MNLLITGGAGFIGSNLALELQKNPENNITIIDNLSSGKEENLDGFNGGIIDIDVSKPFTLEGDFDAIIHEASITDTTFRPDEEMLRQNVEGFKNVIKIAMEKNAALVYASSAAIYGNGETPMKEFQAPQPLNAYGESKLLMDRIAKEHFNKLRIIGLRYFNVFGPREHFKGRSSSMIFQLRKQVLDGKKPRLFSPGDQKRDHIYVKDVIDATIKALDAKASCIVNVGTGIATTFNELIAMIQKTMRTEYRVEYFSNPFTQAYQVHTLADTKKAGLQIGFQAQWKLQEAIADYCAWLEEKGI
ncbi:ADP-glyceromanno-heptose 6-epimerase [Candidatus Woesearchaeota archaeon]|nr:ADP-glyceromanno-heptose 6-epimerase [Candidatus Woesearchaeota archaeon]